MPILEIIGVITPIFIIAVVGFIVGKFKQLSLKTMADLIIYICSPALAFVLLSQTQIDLREISSIALAALLVILGTGAICFLLIKLSGKTVPTGFYLPVMFMNSGFIGYPITLFAFGELGLSKAIIFDITNAILIFTLGIYMISQKKDHWQVLKIPFLYAAIAGIFISWLNIQIPDPVFIPINLVGQITVPMALFMLGYRLANIEITSVKLPLLASLLRLTLGLALGILVVYLLKLDGVTAKVVVLIASTSSAISTIAISEEYNSSPNLVASTIALSTIIWALSIGFILNWVAFIP
ncbi:MAG: AEC family transporter [Candidatus Margulisbacteria bacterium]|nr:AEC family transporter [Candidatus Margulisiibacteriota bacterium]